MARIFISFSRTDRQFVDQLVPLVRRVYGNDAVWFDEEIHGGVDWWQAILSEIASCDVFVYLVSNESLESPYCRAEFREALRLKKQVLPIIVRRLKPTYPGNIETDLAVILRRTQYVDMSGGLNPDTISDLYAALTGLLNNIPRQPATPITLTPTPEPPVQDKKSGDINIRVAYIGGGFLLLSVVLGGIFGLWQGIFANPTLSNQDPTTEAAQSLIETPSNNSSPTLSAFQALTTAEAMRTQEATETAAYATLLALTPTPTATSTSTPDPLHGAFTPVTRNTDWTPIERDFDEVTMVLVPAGCFDMGTTTNSNEQPIHEQCFDEPFWIDKYEVTQAQFQRLGGRRENLLFFPGENRPVEGITWFEARDFCALRDSRLPTEAEWEYAARGPDDLVYPWGNTWNASSAVSYRSDSQGTANVGSIPAGVSWVGAMDMSGNVWEWISSLYENYPYDATDGREADTGTRTDVFRVWRGGAWLNEHPRYFDAGARNGRSPRVRDYGVGFRCARSF